MATLKTATESVTSWRHVRVVCPSLDSARCCGEMLSCSNYYLSGLTHVVVSLLPGLPGCVSALAVALSAFSTSKHQ